MRDGTCSRPVSSCDSRDMRIGSCIAGSEGVMDCHQRNCRHGCLPKHSFHDMMQKAHEPVNEGSLFETGHMQASPQRMVPVHPSCSCSGQLLPEPLRDPDHRNVDEDKYWHRLTGPSTPNSVHTGHLRNVCERGCCSPAAMHIGRTSVTEGAVDAFRPTRSRTSLFSVCSDFPRNDAAVGCMSHFPSMPREVEMRSSSLDTMSMANSLFSTQTSKVSKKQVMLYGWFLMKPTSDNLSRGTSPTTPAVAIGGYKCPRMAEADFFGTAPIVQRLERWKLRASDEVEIGLIGMINVERSVASGFSPPLVQCFMIGFPSTWIYMLLNQNSVSPRCPNHGMASPLPLEESPVHSILKSTLFRTCDEDARMAKDCENSSQIHTSTISKDCPLAFEKVEDIEVPEISVQTHDQTKSKDPEPGPRVGDGEHAAEVPVKAESEDSRPEVEIILPAKNLKKKMDKPSKSAARALSTGENGTSKTRKSARRSNHRVELERSTELAASNDCPEEDAKVENEESHLEEEDGLLIKNVKKKVDKPSKSAARDLPTVESGTRKTRKSARRSNHREELERSAELAPPNDCPEEEAKVEIEEPKSDEEDVLPTRNVKKKIDKPSKSAARDLLTVDSGIKKTYPQNDHQAKHHIVPPPLPSPRVVDKSKVPEAFGLKRSLRGRVIVPPLETWRRQTIKYDMDGGIIAICDGFPDPEAETKSGFKLPCTKDARTMQRKLRKAAEKRARK